MVNQRVRFLKGFDDTALAELNSQLFSVMGEKGISHCKFPLGHAILMSADLLRSSAFGRAKDIEQVLAWRDGARGQELQRRMVGVAARRYFEYGFADSNKILFGSAAAWGAFTRLLNFLEVCHECSQCHCTTKHAHTRTHTYTCTHIHTHTHTPTHAHTHTHAICTNHNHIVCLLACVFDCLAYVCVAACVLVFVKAMFASDCGDAKNWLDAVHSFHRTMWRGEFDSEMLQ